MILENLTNRGATPALINTLSYAEARHAMLAENIANWQTPDYKSKHLDAKKFQAELRKALDRKGADANKTLSMEGSREFKTDARGSLSVTPSRSPVGNLLFHDGTNASIENMMTDLADNAMVFQAANTVLQGYFDGMRKAIRGRS